MSTPSYDSKTSPAPSDGVQDELSVQEYRKMIRRVDYKILPLICVAYCIVRLDLGNISNAGIMNAETGHSLKQVLKLTPQMWANALIIFYGPYAAVEPLSTICVKWTTPSSWISRIMISWGIVMMCMAALTSYAGLMVTRALLGLMEGGFFTGVIFYFSFWYSAAQLAPRILILYMANASSGGVSGLLAYAISFANGRLYGWQVLFLVEGALPILSGLSVFFFLPDFPETAKFLTPSEKAAIQAHLHKNAPRKTDRNFASAEIKKLVKDPTFWFFGLFWASYALGPWAVSPVLPQIVKDMGISDSAGSNLLQIPPAAAAVLFCVASSFLIHNLRISPFLVVLGMQTLCIIAYILLCTVSAAGVRYFAACILNASAPTVYACIWPKRVAAIRGTTATAIGIGMTNALSQLTGLLGPQMYLQSYAPRYIRSFEASAALTAASAVFISVVWWLMHGDLTPYPRLKALVQSQTQPRPEDEVEDESSTRQGNEKAVV